MKTIGLIGGVSPQSTLRYYEKINDITQKLLGKHHSAKLVLVSVDFEEIVFFLTQGAWDKVKEIILQGCLTLETCGVDYIAICSNTMHKVVHSISNSIQVPFIHILDAVIDNINKEKYKKIGLIGTTYTMEENFHKNYITERLNVEIEIPSSSARDEINAIIFNELCRNTLTDFSKKALISVISQFFGRGVEAVILGCTELHFAFSQIDVCIPVLDTTQLHADSLVKKANSVEFDRVYNALYF